MNFAGTETNKKNFLEKLENGYQKLKMEIEKFSTFEVSIVFIGYKNEAQVKCMLDMDFDYREEVLETEDSDFQLNDSYSSSQDSFESQEGDIKRIK